jgi:hypothetical protein
MFYWFGAYVNNIGGYNGIIEGEAGRVNAAETRLLLATLYAEVS